MNNSIAAIEPGSITKERLVFKDNALIMASYTLSIYEQRLVMACIAKVQSKPRTMDGEAIKIQLNVNEYADLYNVKMVTAYKALSESSDKLWDRGIRLDPGDSEKDEEVRWLQSRARYSSGKIELVFSNIVSKFIREITEASAFRLDQATQLRSQNAIRFFEIFGMAVAGRDQAVWDVEVDRLKKLLELEDKYPTWNDFRKKVIDSCLQQINQLTSLKVDWEIAEKSGRNIKAIRFTIFESCQLSLGLPSE